MKAFVPGVVEAVIVSCERTERRRRSLPARGMALHSDGSYEDVLVLISDGLAWAEVERGAHTE